ncbi:cAMP-binding protein [Halobacteroides halobius DSM 5150]|uniref:cAMP-binding protein n=1 Tax=Halobacteroides halobius (strain ATCC 35273 / DSM 5150 / MD-1) TaxID=748449 RepID=L0KAQ1_HALHC|nr:Crp/Fnr family transcriptional regulator [Halobacteroides halobius]AGB41173.1 cAMP-binding protein [Halobacteroides halobius DSM 5150]
MSCSSCVKKVPIFAELDQETIAKIDKLVTRKSYQAGEMIFWEGDPGENLYILNSGQVKIYKTSMEGKEYIVHLLTENDFFGELVLFKEEPLSNNAQAVTDCAVCLINKNDLERLLNHDPKLAHHLLAAFGTRLKETRQMLQSLALDDSKAKTIRFLVNLAQESGIEKKDGVLIKLPLSRKGLADFLAMTPETLSRKLSELQQEDIILLKGQKQVIIKQLDLLKNKY